MNVPGSGDSCRSKRRHTCDTKFTTRGKMLIRKNKRCNMVDEISYTLSLGIYCTSLFTCGNLKLKTEQRKKTKLIIMTIHIHIPYL